MTMFGLHDYMLNLIDTGEYTIRGNTTSGGKLTLLKPIYHQDMQPCRYYTKRKMAMWNRPVDHSTPRKIEKHNPT